MENKVFMTKYGSFMKNILLLGKPQGAHTLFVKFLNEIYFFCLSTCLSSVDFGELCLTVHRTASSCRYANELTFQNEK